MEPTTGIEPVNLFLTKEVLYLLSYVGLSTGWRPSTTSGRYPPGRPRLAPVRLTFPSCQILGAGNGIRTRDPQLGRLTLYQLSYSRLTHLPCVPPIGVCWWRGEDSNLRRLSQQIYSLPPLATREPLHTWSWRWDSNPQPADYKSAALPVELRQQRLSP